MARYERSYSGERRTALLHIQLTPSERAELEAAAVAHGAANLSAYARQLLFRRAAAVVAEMRRNPEAKELADQLRAIGVNLNQLARYANIHGELADRGDDLDEVLTAIKAATARVIGL
jgi:Bacterial mobilisation protein (MobC)